MTSGQSFPLPFFVLVWWDPTRPCRRQVEGSVKMDMNCKQSHLCGGVKHSNHAKLAVIGVSHWGWATAPQYIQLARPYPGEQSNLLDHPKIHSINLYVQTSTDLYHTQMAVQCLTISSIFSWTDITAFARWAPDSPFFLTTLSIVFQSTELQYPRLAW